MEYSPEIKEKLIQLDELVKQNHISQTNANFKRNQIIYGPSYTENIHEEIVQLEELKDDNLISQENFEKKKKEALDKVFAKAVPSSQPDKVGTTTQEETHHTKKSEPVSTHTPADDETTKTTSEHASTVSTHVPTASPRDPTVSTHTPTVSTHTPTDSTHIPTVSTHTPTDSTHTPTDSTHTPTVSTHTPRDPTHAPTVSSPRDPTHVPTVTSPRDPTHAPTVSTHTPRDPTHAPTVSTHDPTVTTHTPTESTHTPTVSTHTPRDPTHTPTVSTHDPTVTTHTPTVSSHTPRDPTHAPTVSSPREPTHVPTVTSPREPIHAPMVTSPRDPIHAPTVSSPRDPIQAPTVTSPRDPTHVPTVSSPRDPTTVSIHTPTVSFQTPSDPSPRTHTPRGHINTSKESTHTPRGHINTSKESNTPRDPTHAPTVTSPRDTTHAPTVSSPRDPTHAPTVTSPRDTTHAPTVTSPRDPTHAPTVSSPRDITHAPTVSSPRDPIHPPTVTSPRDPTHAPTVSSPRDPTVVSTQLQTPRDPTHESIQTPTSHNYTPEVMEQIALLDQLLADGILSDEIYASKKAEVINVGGIKPSNYTDPDSLVYSSGTEQPSLLNSSGTEQPSLLDSCDPTDLDDESREKIAQLEELLADGILSQEDFERKKEEFRAAGRVEYTGELRDKILQLKELLNDGILSQDDFYRKKAEFVNAAKVKEESVENYPLELKEKIYQLDELLKEGVLTLTDYNRKRKQYIGAIMLGLDPIKQAKLAQLEELLKDGVLSQEEYEKRKKELEGPTEREKAEKMFTYFNKEGSGKLDVKEFQALAFEMGEVFTQSEVKKAIEQIDLDGDGLIDFDEFYNWWTNKSVLGDKPVNQRLHFLQMKLQSESYLRSLKGLAEKLSGSKVAVPSGTGSAIIAVDATVTFGKFGKAECGLKVRSDTDKSRAGELRQMVEVSQSDSVAFATIDLKATSGTGMVDAIIKFIKPIVKEVSKDKVQVKLHTTTDGRTQLVIAFALEGESAKGALVNTVDIWDQVKLDVDVDFDQTPRTEIPETIGVQVRAKGSMPRGILDKYRKEIVKDTFLARLLNLFKFGRFNIHLSPIDQILTNLFHEKKSKKKEKNEEKSASPFPVIKGWSSIKEAFAYTIFKFLSEKDFRENIGFYWQAQSIIEKVSCLGLVVKDTVVELALHNLNVFDLLPTKEDLGLDNPFPFQIVRDDLKMLVFDVKSPKDSSKKIKGKKSDSSSSDDEDEDKEAEKNEGEEKKGRYNYNYKSILVPNLRYYQHPDEESFQLLFEYTGGQFNISHIIVKTPRFTKHPLRRVLLFAYNSDPRIIKPKVKDDDSDSDNELKGIFNEKKKKVIWPPEGISPGKPVPFAYIEIPADKFYVEHKLSRNVQGRFIKALFIDGWQKERRDAPPMFTCLGFKEHSKISVEFVGFVGPADPGEIRREIGTKFGIMH